MNRSLRAQLIMGTAIGAATVLIGSGVTLDALFRASLIEQFDRALIDKARFLASCVEMRAGQTKMDFEDLDMREFEAKRPRAYLQIWNEDGSTLFRSPSLVDADLERMGAGSKPVVRWVRLPAKRGGDRSARAVGLLFLPRLENAGEEGAQGRAAPGAGGRAAAVPPRKTASQTLALVMARDASSVEETLNRLAILLASLGAATVAVTLGVLWWVIRRSMRPLDQLASQIGQLDEHDLSSRVAAPAAPSEMQPVIERLNDLLIRLEAAFQRERAFSADVAHELRTPLAGLRSTMEVTLSRRRSPAEYEEALRDCLQIAGQTQGMVENLMSLARLDAGQVEVRRGEVVLDDLLRAAWKPLEAAARARRLDVEWDLGAPPPALSDSSLLALVVRNILENAIAHCDEGGRVKIETFAREGVEGMVVTNTGSSLPADQPERLFDRFWRGDAARSATGHHCGLGLSLVRKIVSLLSGSVTVRPNDEGRFSIAISVPMKWDP